MPSSTDWLRIVNSLVALVGAEGTVLPIIADIVDGDTFLIAGGDSTFMGAGDPGVNPDITFQSPVTPSSFDARLFASAANGDFAFAGPDLGSLTWDDRGFANFDWVERNIVGSTFSLSGSTLIVSGLGDSVWQMVVHAEAFYGSLPGPSPALPTTIAASSTTGTDTGIVRLA